MSFIEAFIQARMRKMYPDGSITLQREPYDNYYEVRMRIPDKCLMMARADKESAARYLDQKLFPSKPRARKHWSLLRSKR